ncbi:MAG: signal peptidase I [Candidatus Onthoplasma sp.]
MNKHTKNILLNIFSSIIVSLTILLSVFGIFVLGFNSTYEKHVVRGYSMQPTLNNSVSSIDELGDYAYVNTIGTLNRGDIVVAEVDWNSQSIIKRLVALPGDELEIRELNNYKDGEDYYGVFVNNKLLYTKKQTTASSHGVEGKGSIYYYNQFLSLFDTPITKIVNGHTVVVDMTENVVIGESGNPCLKMKESQYFLMGDNWGETTDSVFRGPAKKEEINGRVDLIIYKSENHISAWLKYIFCSIFCVENIKY